MRHTLLVAVLFATASIAAAPPARAGEARERLAAFTDGLRSLDAKFTQQVYDADKTLKETATGTLALNAPRQFRWSYEEPFPQLIVADGDNVWIWDEDLEQVTVKNQSLEEAQSPLTVLIDPAQLERDYAVTEPPAHDNLVWLDLAPKSDEAPFARAEIGFDPEADAAISLKRMVLTDTLGQRNELTFRQLQRNPALAPEHFRFTPPAGADVIGEPVRSAEVKPIAD